jgi:hypothetical protein
MRYLLGLPFTLLLLVLAGLGLYVLCLNHLEWFIPVDERPHPLVEGRRREQLDDQRDEMRDRLQLRIAVCQNVAQERLTLLEAAAWFRYLDAQPPIREGPPLVNDPGKSEGERLCRKVIRLVEMVFDRYDPADAAALKALRVRLDAELEKLLDSADTITLPEMLPHLPTLDSNL